jgi:hypothetical protein
MPSTAMTTYVVPDAPADPEGAGAECDPPGHALRQLGLFVGPAVLLLHGVGGPFGCGRCFALRDRRFLGRASRQSAFCFGLGFAAAAAR